MTGAEDTGAMGSMGATGAAAAGYGAAAGCGATLGEYGEAPAAGNGLAPSDALGADNGAIGSGGPGYASGLGGAVGHIFRSGEDIGTPGIEAFPDMPRT